MWGGEKYTDNTLELMVIPQWSIISYIFSMRKNLCSSDQRKGGRW